MWIPWDWPGRQGALTASCSSSTFLPHPLTSIQSHWKVWPSRKVVCAILTVTDYATLLLFSALYPSTVPRRTPTRLTLPPSSSRWGISSGSSQAPLQWAPRMQSLQHWYPLSLLGSWGRSRAANMQEVFLRLDNLLSSEWRDQFEFDTALLNPPQLWVILWSIESVPAVEGAGSFSVYGQVYRCCWCLLLDSLRKTGT